MHTVRRFLVEETGTTAIEYAIIGAGIAVAIMAAVASLGTTVSGMYSNVATALK